MKKTISILAALSFIASYTAATLPVSAANADTDTAALTLSVASNQVLPGESAIFHATSDADVSLVNASTGDVIATMADDGKYSTSGDLIAGDGIYSCLVSANTIGDTFTGIAATSDDQSASVSVQVIDYTSDDCLTETNSVLSALSDLVDSSDYKAMTDADKIAAFTQALNNLAESGYVQADSIAFDETTQTFSFLYTSGAWGYGDQTGVGIPTWNNSTTSTDTVSWDAENFTEFLESLDESETIVASAFDYETNAVYLMSEDQLDVAELCANRYRIILSEDTTIDADFYTSLSTLITDENGDAVTVQTESGTNASASECYLTKDETAETTTWLLSVGKNYTVNEEGLLRLARTISGFDYMDYAAYGYFHSETPNSMKVGSATVTGAEASQTASDFTDLMEFDSFICSESDSTLYTIVPSGGTELNWYLAVRALMNSGAVTALNSFDYSETELGFEIDSIAHDDSVRYFKVGDLDNNGSIDIQDSYQTLLAYAKRSAGLDMELTVAQSVAADFDNDGTISIQDAYQILLTYARIAVGLNPDGSVPTDDDETTVVETTVSE